MRYPHPSVCGPHTPLSPSTKLVTPEGKCWYSGLVNSKARTFIQIYFYSPRREGGSRAAGRGIQMVWILLPQCSLWSTNGLNSTQLSSSQWMRLNESGHRSHSWLMEQFVLSTDQDFDKGTSLRMHYYLVTSKCEEMPAAFVSSYPCNNWWLRKTCWDSF